MRICYIAIGLLLFPGGHIVKAQSGETDPAAFLFKPGRECSFAIPSPESVIRHALLGNGDIRTEFDRDHVDSLFMQYTSGSLTSQACIKRWNRKNEQLALATEPLAVMADWLGGIRYPHGSLNESWRLVLGNQMYDNLPETAVPKTCEHAWNDAILALNKFSATLESSAGVVIRAMDTRGKGKTIVVYNPLTIDRKDVVEAEIHYPEGAPKDIKVFDSLNNELPAQTLERSKERIRILFLCTIPSMGLACFDVRSAGDVKPAKTTLTATEKMLDNEFLKITINSAGDISSIIDKKPGKELLSAPIRLEFQKEHPVYWPARYMDWKDRKKPPMEHVRGPAKITVLEKGPVRATVKIERKAMNSVFTQYIQLTAGMENLIIRNNIRWQSSGVSLKASFPLTASNSVATYNLGLGAREWETNNENKFEFPSLEWIDLTDKSGIFGVTISEDCKYGSDKPNDNTLRLTLLYTPKTNNFHDQATQDWGIHDITYGLYSHKGDWRTGLSEWQGRRLNQPLRVFQVPHHPGFLGKGFSFANVSVPQVDIRAIKKAENGKDVVIRLQELVGHDINGVTVTMASKIARAWEIDSQERLVGEAVISNGKLMVDMKKYDTRSFAVQLEPPVEKLADLNAFALPLVYDQNVVSGVDSTKKGHFNPQGISIPARIFPETLLANGVLFNLGPAAYGKNNVLTCMGQKIILPKTGNFNQIYILAAALTDTSGTFKAGGSKFNLRIQASYGNIGQSDHRIRDKFGRIKGLQTGFINRDEVAWFASPLRRDTVTITNQYTYMFKYKLEAGPGSETLQLPDNESIKIFAISLAYNPFDQIQLAQPLYDDFTGRQPLSLNLPKSYVDETMEPAAKIYVYKNRDLAGLPGRVTMKDFADIHQPNGVTSSYYFTDADTTLTGNVRDGMIVPAINDGMFDLLPGDLLNDKWSDIGEGRILLDLQQEIELDSMHVFTGQSISRGGQSFSLWGATGGKNLTIKNDPKTSGWDFIAMAPPEDVFDNSKVMYSIILLPGKPKQYRYLLWVSENTPHGPFYFREVDVYEKQN